MNTSTASNGDLSERFYLDLGYSEDIVTTIGLVEFAVSQRQIDEKYKVSLIGSLRALVNNERIAPAIRTNPYLVAEEIRELAKRERDSNLVSLMNDLAEDLELIPQPEPAVA